MCNIVLYLIKAEWRIYASVNDVSFVQVMACRLLGTKPLFEQMQAYSQSGPLEQI